LRLVLDEHLSPVIATSLRQRDHDVVSVTEVNLAGVADSVVLEWAIQVGRAVVTADVGDFRPVHQAYVDHGQESAGLILLSSSRFSPARSAFGVLIEALDAFLASHPGQHDLACAEHWL
jgi:predicted nuclease of predicted toxin-antitoxin system